MRELPARGPADLASWLAAEREDLVRLAGRRAGGALLRLESAEDLAQGILTHVLAREDQAPAEPAARRQWLARVAENFLHDRRDHWAALKRSGSGILRAGIAEDATSELSDLGRLAASVTGPSTFSMRREQLEIAACAIDLLLPRDRSFVQGMSEELPIEEQARMLGLSYDAVVQGRRRALERLRRSFRLVLGERGGV